ncbi:hypothetical protein Pan44_51260 [Caulifigura coniformis]|uniref:Uncharacterized protein n=1 Tax=Caulifigura coniformis TaxID=2527983 RepID=A0A517SLS2_9PLAN|nr:hypothetical protein Pan44_51260 [Caulifigura coniformis]
MNTTTVNLSSHTPDPADSISAPPTFSRSLRKTSGGRKRARSTVPPTHRALLAPLGVKHLRTVPDPRPCLRVARKAGHFLKMGQFVVAAKCPAVTTDDLL